MSTLNELKSKFFALDNSEQKTVIVGILFVVLFLLYIVVYKPMNSTLTQLQQSNVKNQELLIWMKESVAQLKGSGKGKNSANKRGNRSLSEVINTSAASAKVSISRSQPRENNQYQIWLDKVVFDDMVDWIERLTRDYGVAVNSVNLGATDSNGMVRASITFHDFGR